jgi:hypothetical protein
VGNHVIRTKCGAQTRSASPSHASNLSIKISHHFCSDLLEDPFNTNIIIVRQFLVATLACRPIAAMSASASANASVDALREHFGDRKPPDISRKVTACVACRKQKVGAREEG